jgi:hypothetical protein
MAIALNDKEFKNKIYKKFDNKFTITNTYKNMKTPIVIRCNTCKTDKLVNPQKFMYSDNPEWCDKCANDARINKQISIIKTEFPMKTKNGSILFLDNISYINKRKHYILIIHDEFNYKYQFEYGCLKATLKYNNELRRFFQRNPFTCNNIQNYINLNNINLTLITTGLYSGNAREKLEFIDKNKSTVFISWNDISNNTERYLDKNYDLFFRHRKVREITKDEATRIIYKMQTRLDRPLYQDDFDHPTEDTIGIRIVNKIWGNLSNMQRDLGLTLTGKFAQKVPSNKYLEYIKDVCDKVYQCENRTLLMVNDFRKYGVAYSKSYENQCKANGTTLRKVLKSLGFDLQKAGNGFNYNFNNGEHVVSKNEYEFSNYLNNIGLEYNKDYFRDVRYDKLSNEYKGNMNCDYEIHFQGRIFYIELAGMLENTKHQECYKNNISINSKSKEKYRLDLIKKKTILEKENLEYYILLKSEMNEDTYKNILNNSYKEVA